MKKIIRKANFGDFKVIYGFICELELKILDQKKFRKIFLENLKNPNINYLVAEFNNQIVGFLSLHFQSLLHHTGKSAEIQELFVDSQFRNQGVGESLINAAKKIVKTNKADVFEVCCNQRRKKAHHFYEKFGFIKSHNKFTQ